MEHIMLGYDTLQQRFAKSAGESSRMRLISSPGSSANTSCKYSIYKEQL